MKVAVPTIEITDREREIIAAQLEDIGRREGRGKLASRTEVKRFLLEAIYLQIEGLELWWEDIGPGRYEDEDFDDFDLE